MGNCKLRRLLSGFQRRREARRNGGAGNDDGRWRSDARSAFVPHPVVANSVAEVAEILGRMGEVGHPLYCREHKMLWFDCSHITLGFWVVSWECVAGPPERRGGKHQRSADRTDRYLAASGIAESLLRTRIVARVPPYVGVARMVEYIAGSIAAP